MAPIGWLERNFKIYGVDLYGHAGPMPGTAGTTITFNNPPEWDREGFFNPEPIRTKWLEHLSGKRRWHYHLWDVLMFQAWLESAGQARPSSACAPRTAIPATAP